MILWYFFFLPKYLFKGITFKCDGSEDDKINPRVMKNEEIRQGLEKNLFSNMEEDSDIETLFNEFAEKFSNQVTYERNTEVKSTNEEESDSDSGSEDLLLDDDYDREELDDKDIEESIIIRVQKKTKLNELPEISNFIVLKV